MAVGIFVVGSRAKFQNDCIYRFDTAATQSGGVPDFAIFRASMNFDPCWNGNTFSYRKRENIFEFCYFQSISRSKPRVSSMQG